MSVVDLGLRLCVRCGSRSEDCVSVVDLDPVSLFGT